MSDEQRDPSWDADPATPEQMHLVERVCTGLGFEGYFDTTCGWWRNEWNRPVFVPVVRSIALAYKLGRLDTCQPDLWNAAQAVIDRWDTPAWKDVPATAEYIGRLRQALAAAPTPQTTQAADYKAWYDEAMVASNEAGFAGMSAAETIRALAEEVDKRMTHSPPAEVPADGYVTITTNEAGECVAVTRNDEEGRVLSVLWKRRPAKPSTPPGSNPGIEGFVSSGALDVLVQRSLAALAAAPQPAQECDTYRAALEAIRACLQKHNEDPNGPIRDTIWYSNHETLFDFIEAVVEGARLQQVAHKPLADEQAAGICEAAWTAAEQETADGAAVKEEWARFGMHVLHATERACAEAWGVPLTAQKRAEPNCGNGCFCLAQCGDVYAHAAESADAEDAARYRWLRQKPRALCFMKTAQALGLDLRNTCVTEPEHLDAVIDARRTKASNLAALNDVVDGEGSDL